LNFALTTIPCSFAQLNEALEELELEKGKELLALQAALDDHRRVADQVAAIPQYCLRARVVPKCFGVSASYGCKN
jgi:hypothetical protein